MREQDTSTSFLFHMPKQKFTRLEVRVLYASNLCPICLVDYIMLMDIFLITAII